MNIRSTLSIVTAGLLFAAAAPAWAGEISYKLYSNADGTSSQTGPAQTINGSSANFNLPLFDSSLGTLTAVTLHLSSNVGIIAQVTNISGNTDNFTNSNATLPFTLSDSLGTNINGSESAGPGAGSVGPHTTVTSATSTTDYENSASVASTNFATYTGGPGGTISVAFNVGTVQASGNGVPGQTFFGGQGSSDAAVTVIYDYTGPAPVPEPASMAILGAGLLGAGLLRRRRR